MHKIYLCLFQWSLIARLIQNLIQKIKVIFVKIQTYEFLTTITFIILSMINIPCSWFITVYDNSYYIVIPIFRWAFWFWINHRQKHMQTYVNCSITNCTWFGNLKKNFQSNFVLKHVTSAFLEWIWEGIKAVGHYQVHNKKENVGKFSNF